MIIAKSSVMALATRMGILLLYNPNRNHSKVPVAKSEYINNDIPLVSFVWIVFIACGRNEAVVNKAAAKPKIVIAFMILFDNYLKSELEVTGLKKN